jgi:chemotaxis protein MotB
MGAQTNVAPVIIKRKKVIKGGGHHGGAWKVAYADFVTAMMAFFMLMWLLNATTEKQRKGLADYFSPTIAIARVSGGGDGAFGGDSVFSEETLPQNGTGASSDRPTEAMQARGLIGMDDDGSAREMQALSETVEAALNGFGGESQVMENVMRHIITRVTDQGLVIELFALDGAPLFVGATDEPTPLLKGLAAMISEVTRIVTNPVSVGAHVRADPVVQIRNQVWDMSAARADKMRALLEAYGMPSARIHRVISHADRDPAVADPMAERNNRIEIILLRPRYDR